jgi:hypothetical protein
MGHSGATRGVKSAPSSSYRLLTEEAAGPRRPTVVSAAAPALPVATLTTC